MTKVEEALDAEPEFERRQLPRSLGLEICPACRAECEIGEVLVHREGCPRAATAASSAAPARRDPR